MKTDLFAYNPFNLYAVALGATLEATKTAQETVFHALERAAHPDEKPVDWVKIDMPVVNTAFYLDEEMMRDGFHRLADANLRGWSFAADLLQAMPSWTMWPMRVPGSVMTDWFDQVRRTGMSMMPANDSWATAAENFSPPAFWAAAPTGPVLLEVPNGEPDDLTQIKGIGPKLSTLLNDLGIYHYAQIAAWSDADGEWIDDKLAFKGRVAREQWIAQAKALAGESAAA